MRGLALALLSLVCAVSSAVASPVSGFIFLDGAYLPGPYHLETCENVLFINEVPIQAHEFDLVDFELGPDESLLRDEPGIDLPNAFSEFCHWVKCSLQSDVLILYRGMKPATLSQGGLGYEVLRSLAGKPNEFQNGLTDIDVRSGYTANDVALATRLVANHNVGPSFVGKVASITEVFDDNETRTSANIWMGRLGYPLTIFAMVVVVIAFGHLMSNQPNVDSSEQGDGEQARKVVLKSLAIVGMLSVVDLVWTLAAFYSGMMREMNPVGNNFISDPVTLTAFKGVATSLAIGLLYYLHERPIAQVASWWSCLVLTLLTARWLVFNSMFM